MRRREFTQGLLVTAGLGAGGALAAGDAHANDPATDFLRDWWLLEEIRILPGSVTQGRWYRLANRKNGMQLAADRSSPVRGLTWAAVPDGGRGDDPRAIGPNVQVARLVWDPEYETVGPVGHEVELNELVALRFGRAGYLTFVDYRRGPRLEWREHARIRPFSKAPGTYQWRFEIPRDHRRIALRTKVHLALFNVEVGAYLLTRDGSGGQRLHWHERRA